jgi:hypothetical protein
MMAYILPLPYYLFPIPYSPFPIPYSPFPISLFPAIPIPHFPVPAMQVLVQCRFVLISPPVLSPPTPWPISGPSPAHLRPISVLSAHLRPFGPSPSFRPISILWAHLPLWRGASQGVAPEMRPKTWCISVRDGPGRAHLMRCANFPGKAETLAHLRPNEMWRPKIRVKGGSPSPCPIPGATHQMGTSHVAQRLPRAHLTWRSAFLGRISGASQAHLRRISGACRVHLGLISPYVSINPGFEGKSGPSQKLRLDIGASHQMRRISFLPPPVACASHEMRRMSWMTLLVPRVMGRVV